MDIAALRMAAGLTQRQAAAAFKVSIRTWKYWEAGQPMPFAAWHLLRMLAGQSSADDLRNDAIHQIAFNLFKKQGYASITLLSRRLKINYKLAGDVIHYLQSIGAIGEPVLAGGCRPVLLRSIQPLNGMSKEIEAHDNAERLQHVIN